MTHIFIARACSDLPVAACCRVMKVSTSGFYAWQANPVSDDGIWKGSGKTVKMTFPGGYLSPGTFKGRMTVNGDFVGLLSNKGLSPSGPEELAPGSDPFGIGTCAPQS